MTPQHSDIYHLEALRGGGADGLAAERQRVFESLPPVAQSRVTSVELAQRILEGSVQSVVGAEVPPQSHVSINEAPRAIADQQTQYRLVEEARLALEIQGQGYDQKDYRLAS